MKVRLCEKCNHGEVCKIRTEQVGGCIYFVPKQAKSKMSINLDEEIALYKEKVDFYKDYPVTNDIMVRELEFVLVLLEQIKNSSKKGKWIKLSDTPNGLHRYKCSECECIFALHSECDILNYHFSPCCGSPMEDYEDADTRDYWKWVNEE